MRRCAPRRSRSGNKAIFSLPLVATYSKSGLLAAKSPGYVGVIRFNLFQIDSFGQENGKPWLWCHCFRIRFVNLNLDVAGLHAHVAEPPLPHKDAPRIKRCRDATSIE